MMLALRVTAAALAIAVGLVMVWPTHVSAKECGGASWYGLESCSNKRCLMANGKRFNPGAMTAAHKSLKFGTVVRVVDQSTGKAVTVTITDRGPFVRGRIIDLSKSAAIALGMHGRGVAKVCLSTR